MLHDVLVIPFESKSVKEKKKKKEKAGKKTHREEKNIK